MNIQKTECDSQTGITVGLIDTIITVSNLLGERDLSPIEVQEALKDLRSNPKFSLLSAPVSAYAELTAVRVEESNEKETQNKTLFAESDISVRGQ